MTAQPEKYSGDTKCNIDNIGVEDQERCEISITSRPSQV